MLRNCTILMHLYHKLFECVVVLCQSCSYAAHLSAGMDRLVEGPLKNLNPDKLMKWVKK